jgi:predicted nuclease of predicted toxin-antitoxin system
LIRLLADENVPRASVARLRSAGHDVAIVTAGASDEEVLERAASEQRVIVSFDRDFGRLALDPRAPRPLGVVLLREVPVSPDVAATSLLDLLERTGLVLEHTLTVVRAGRVRQRAMPY